MNANKSAPILVIGATGKTGQHVVNELKNRGAIVRVLVRAKDAAKALFGGGVEIFAGFDYDEANTAASALKGVEKLYLVSGSAPNWVEQTKGIIDQAKYAGVKHIVRLSVFGLANRTKGFGATEIGRRHLEIEKYIQENGFAYTFLRPMCFNQNIAWHHAFEIQNQFQISSQFGPTAKVNFIDARDIAAVAAIALTSSGHENKIYELAGPQSLSMTEVAQILSKQLGKEIKFVDMTEGQAKERLISWGVPASEAALLAIMFNQVRLGNTGDLTDDLKKLIGNRGITLETFMADNIEQFRPPLVKQK
jgi:uncharacterized protein YbjT (DUF2867 family)